MIRIIISVAGVVLSGAIFFLYTQPTYDKVQEIQSKIAEYNQALDKAAELQKIKDSLLSRLNAFRQEDIDNLQKLLPDHVDNVRLILDMDQLAHQHSIPLENVEISSDAPTAGKTAVGTIGADTRKYGSLTIKFGTTATYEGFLKFLDDLQSSLRIVDISQIGLTPTGAVAIRDPAVGPEPTYRYSLMLKTYWLK